MAILRREDGVQFAIQTYRESLTTRKASLLKRQIRLLAEQQGEHIRLFKQADGTLEGVFSSDPGLLLGEAIWYQFNQPDNFIFCEALDDNQHAILVVAKRGKVLLDTKVTLNMIAEELTPLLSDDVNYDTYIFGNVPITDTATPGLFLLEPHLLKSFTRIPQAIFPNLQANKQFQLQPLELALSAQHLGKRSPASLAAFAVLLLFVAGMVWHFYHRQHIPEPTAQEDPLQQYYAALSTPAPNQQVNEMINVLGFVYDIPGWKISRLNSTGGSYTVLLNSTGGTVQMLQQWADEHKVNLNLTSQGANLVLPSKLKSRPKPTSVTNAQHAIGQLIDRMDQLLPQKSTSIGTIANHEGFKETTLNIKFTNASPDVVKLIARELAGLPVKLASEQLVINENLLSGSISITVLGN